ncbi:MAG: hypothetical protein RBT53_00390 [Azonexus sp.]|jgi:Flp pilus assembly protein TadD|nr:hypothetical protein [Azonexus sp.]
MKPVQLLLCLACLLPAQLALAQDAPPAEAAQEIRRDESNPDFYLELIAGMQQKRLFYASLAHLDVFEQRWPGDRRALLLRADALRSTGDFERARQHYRRLLDKGALPGAWHGLGLIAAAEGDLPAAATALGQAVALAPIDVRILNDLGYLQLLLGERDAARLSLHKAAELAPENRQAGANLALWYLLAGHAGRAEQIMGRHGFTEAQRLTVRADAQRIGQGGAATGNAFGNGGEGMEERTGEQMEMVK